MSFIVLHESTTIALACTHTHRQARSMDEFSQMRMHTIALCNGIAETSMEHRYRPGHFEFKRARATSQIGERKK